MYHPWGRDPVERDESGKIAGRRWLLGKEPDLEASGNNNSEVGTLALSNVPSLNHTAIVISFVYSLLALQPRWAGREGVGLP